MPRLAWQPLRKKLGDTYRNTRWFIDWAVNEFPKSPSLELYGRVINRDNLKLTVSLIEAPVPAFAEYVAPYQGKDIPKILWIYWAQGEHEAPSLVRRCIASWRSKNPDWTINVMNQGNIGEFADLSALNPSTPLRLQADYARLRLLEKFGGVWTDATTFCHCPLSDWMPLMGGQTGFFMFRGPYHDRWVDSWFIAANAGSDLVAAWAGAFSDYLRRVRPEPSMYFAVIYSLQWLLMRNKALRLVFRASGGLPAVPAFYLQAYLEGRSGPEAFLKARQAGFPVSKLNWRLEIDDQELDVRLAKLDI
jgi:hypothetical protein